MGMIFRQKRRQNWMMKYYRDGRPIVESSGTDDKTEAKKTLRSRETDIDKGLPMSAQVGKLRFAEARTDIERNYKFKGNSTTADLQRRITLHLEPVFGGRRMSTITSPEITAYVDSRLDEDASHAQINRELAALKRMFTLAVQSGKLLMRPYIPMLSEKGNVRQGFFELEEFRGVHSHLPKFLQGPIAFGYYTGWRIRDEIFTLEWRQVDFNGGVVRLDKDTTKNEDGRTFPFDVMPPLLALLQAQHKKRKGLTTALVFPDGDGPIKVRQYYVDWHLACVAAGWPDKIPHDFRRTAVRNLVRSGVPEKQAMLLTGHKTRSVFDRYDIVNEADLREAVQRYANAPAPKARTTGRVVRMRTRAK